VQKDENLPASALSSIAHLPGPPGRRGKSNHIFTVDATNSALMGVTIHHDNFTRFVRFELSEMLNQAINGFSLIQNRYNNGKSTALLFHETCSASPKVTLFAATKVKRIMLKYSSGLYKKNDPTFPSLLPPPV
jgi:hypothetical protein